MKTAASGATNNMMNGPDTPVSVEAGSVRIQLLSDTLLRIEAKGQNGYEDRPSFTVPTRTGFSRIDYSLSEENGKAVIKTSSYTVYVPQNADDLSDVSVTDASGKELWRFSGLTKSSVFLPSPSDELKSWYFADNPRVIPSENGYSLPEGKSYEKNNGWEISYDAQDVFVFLPDGDYRTFTSDLVMLTGRSEMVSLDLLGYWDSRWYAYSEETALKQIADYKEKGYPIDVMVIDTDWRISSGGTGYDINAGLFPDMASFLEKAHKENVTIYFNDHPEPAEGTDNLLDEKEIGYRTDNLTRILSLGLDHWWYDRNWRVALNPVADGLSIYTTGMYAFHWITKEFLKKAAGNNDLYPRRALIMGNVDGIRNGVITNPPELAAHRYSIQWTGDISTDPLALEQEICNLVLSGAEMGLPYVSSDLGGHSFEVSKKMYVRWIQYGALSNICRVHCTKPYSRMPWLYGKTAEEVTKEYVGIRYRLLPLFYGLAHENYISGLPVMRRLDINYPRYIESSLNNEYLLGDYILAAPISGVRETHPVPDAMLTHDGLPGLKAEYYKNRDLSGEPCLIKTDRNIIFDWTTVGPKELGAGSDFSIRWTGDITVGDKDILLRFYSDDGIRVWIDGECVIDGWEYCDQFLLSPERLKAGTTHSLKVEYFQAGGNAHVNMAYTEKFDDSRDVFIPDGEWIDVWTGKRVTGPATVSVEHPLETSPLYVRSGAVVPLADNMTNTREKNWSVIALDVYPSKNFDASAVIYEDDAETEAYKYGRYRTTDVRMSYSDSLNISIGAAKGSFESDFRAFGERTYKVRIHARSDFGKMTGITLDGKETEVAVYPVTKDASPFAFSGGARDSDIFEIRFDGSVYEPHEIKVFFETPVDDRVRNDYDKSAVDFDVALEKIEKVSLDASSGADLDYAVFGTENPDSVIRKKNGRGLIGDCRSEGKRFSFSDNYPISWTDGDIAERGYSVNGTGSKKAFKVRLLTVEGKMRYELYIGGWKSLSKITVRDRAGYVKTVTLGDMETNYYRKVTINCDSATASELYFDYSLISGENITFSLVKASVVK